ncbi:MAG: hypothetical protein U9O06_11430 [Euryarchaeota archaeon]|nr:hypothetical protein [Euryarchaeota archaeon]
MTDWELYVEDGVVVANFSDGMPSDAEEYTKVNEQFEELAAQGGVNAHLSLLNMSSSLNKDVFEKAKEAAEVGTEYGITKWAIVSDGIKSMALSSQVKDVAGVDVETFNNEADALAWAAE